MVGRGLKNLGRTPPTILNESFQLQMGFSFPFLCAKDLSMSLLIMRTCRFLTLMYIGGTYALVVYIWYKNVFRMIAVLIVFCAANKKKEPDENSIKTRQRLDRG